MSSMIMVTTTAMVVALIVSIITSIKESELEKKQEKMSFECGYMNMNPNKMTFSTNFIMIIVLFIVFDLEASIMVPMIMSSVDSKLKKMIPTLFLTALTAILVKEWLQGAMEWAK